MKMRAVLVFFTFSVFCSGCTSADAQVAFFTSTSTGIPVTQEIPITTPEPTLTPEIIQTDPNATQPTANSNFQETPLADLPYQSFNLTLSNPSGWDTHLFVDNVFALTIPAGERLIYSGLKGGERTLHFCQVKDVLTCEPPKLVFINGDLEWVIGEELPKSIVIRSGPGTGSTPVLLPVFIPPRNHKIKVNNRTPWEIYIFIEGQKRLEPTETPSLRATEETGKPEDEYAPFLVIPSNSHRTYDGLTTGTYTFIHCTYKTMKNCFLEKTIVLERDTEWYVYP